MFRVLRISTAVLALGLLAACGQADLPAAVGTRPVQAAMPAARPTPPSASTSSPAPSGLGTLAYIQQGDLWVRDLPAGEPRRLTRSGRASAPRWSPSGDWLAYCADDQLYVLRADAADQHALGLCEQVAWAPGADRLLHGGETGLRITTPGSWREQRVPGDAGVWSPDGATLTVSSERAAAVTEGPPRRSTELWRVKADGSGAARIENAAGGDSGVILAGWAGPQLLFWDSALLSASLLADGAPLRAAEPDGFVRELVPSMLAYRDFLAASPDGSALAVTAGDGRATWAGKQIVTIDMDSGERRPLTGEDTAALSPAWSPDGALLAYAAAPAVSADSDERAVGAALARRRIWTSAPDGSGARRLTDDPHYRDERPLWSGDGASLLFARIDQQDRASLWLVRADGGGLTLVADGLTFDQGGSPWAGSYGYIDWSAAFDWHR